MADRNEMMTLLREQGWTDEEFAEMDSEDMAAELDLPFYNYMTNEWTNDAVEQKGVRWFIKSGFAGFNTPANNGSGYVSEHRAIAVIQRYQSAR